MSNPQFTESSQSSTQHLAGADDQATGLSRAEQSLVADLVADGLSIQDNFHPEPFYKEAGTGHYESKTVDEIRKARDTQKTIEHHRQTTKESDSL